MGVEKISDSSELFKEAKSIFREHMSNYFSRPGDEDKISLDKLKIISSKTSKTKTLESIEKFIIFIEKEIKNNYARFSQDRDDAVIRKIGNKIVKEVLSSRKDKVKRNKKVSQKVEKIIKK